MSFLKKAIHDVWSYRAYILYTVASDLKTQTAGTLLGYLWWVLDPLMSMLVYVLVIRVIFQRGEPDYPVFLFCGLIPWKWTQTAINGATNSIRGKLSLLQQIYMPKSVLVITEVLSSTVDFMFGLAILSVMLLIFGTPLSLFYLEFVPVALVHFCFLLGLALIFAHLGVYFWDIRNILSFMMRLWFFLSPVLYSLERIPARARPLWWLNPMTPFFVSYRNVLLHARHPAYPGLLVWLCVSIGLIVLGLCMLQRFDRKYTKVG